MEAEKRTSSKKLSKGLMTNYTPRILLYLQDQSCLIMFGVTKRMWCDISAYLDSHRKRGAIFFHLKRVVVSGSYAISNSKLILPISCQIKGNGNWYAGSYPEQRYFKYWNKFNYHCQKTHRTCKLIFRKIFELFSNTFHGPHPCARPM